MVPPKGFEPIKPHGTGATIQPNSPSLAERHKYINNYIISASKTSVSNGSGTVIHPCHLTIHLHTLSSELN